MVYQYKMVQVPPVIEVQAKENKKNIAAAYLQKIVNQEALTGWEFYRVDSIGIHSTPGCIASIFGQKAQTIEYYVVTFRKEH